MMNLGLNIITREGAGRVILDEHLARQTHVLYLDSRIASITWWPEAKTCDENLNEAVAQEINVNIDKSYPGDS